MKRLAVVAVCVWVVAGCANKDSKPAASESSEAHKANPGDGGAPGVEATKPDHTQIDAWIVAVREVDIAESRQIEAAIEAAAALAESGQSRAVTALAQVVRQKWVHTPPVHRLKIACIKALGSFHGDSVAVEALVGVLAPQNEVPVQLVGAAVLALADQRAEAAIVPLLRTLLAVPPLYQQVRRALVATGPPVVDHLRRAIRGEHAEMNTAANELKLDIDCAKALGPDTSCTSPAAVTFKALTLLGDMRATDAIDDIAAVLDTKRLPLFVQGEQWGPTQHEAAIDALAKIGGVRAAPALLRYVVATQRDPAVRALAVMAYATIAPDTQDIETIERLLTAMPLGKGDVAYFLAYARMASTDAHVATLRSLIDRMPGRDGDLSDAAITAASQGAKCDRDVACLVSLVQSADVDTARGTWIADRAFIDLARVGDGARAATAALLEVLPTTNRLVRDGAVFALTAVAELPCNACVERLDSIIELQNDDTALASLTVEAKVARSYFRWATKR